MQSWMALLVAGMLLGPVSGSAVAFADTPSVPTQTQDAVARAHQAWQDGLGSREACSSGVSMIFEALDGRRGEYRTGAAQVVIDPTDDVSGIESIVVHELSHHTFLACGAFADSEFKEAFYASQGIPAERDWFDYSHGWGNTPAEHFAEAMAVTLWGSGEGGIAVGRDTQSIIARWLAGAPVKPPSADEYEPVPYSPISVAESSTEDGGRSDTTAVPAAAAKPQSPPAAAAAPVAAAEVEPISYEVFGQVFTFIKNQHHRVLWLQSWRHAGLV
ncbi:MAG: hypothetical protein QNJ89_05120 [Acidimicrobiia bacterium]|nr:hypothetical protein [Acidimicrobiia bacterium]